MVKRPTINKILTMWDRSLKAVCVHIHINHYQYETEGKNYTVEHVQHTLQSTKAEQCNYLFLYMIPKCTPYIKLLEVGVKVSMYMDIKQ